MKVSWACACPLCGGLPTEESLRAMEPGGLPEPVTVRLRCASGHSWHGFPKDIEAYVASLQRLPT